MRKLIFIALFILAGLAGSAQTKVVVNKDGNYVSAVKPKTEPKDTGKFFILPNGDKLPVFENSEGRLFIVRVSRKTGKKYTQYLTVEHKIN